MYWENGDDIRRAIIKNAKVAEDAAIGVVSIAGKNVTADRSNRLIWVTATTTDIDSDQEVVVASGAAKDSRFFTLKNIFVDHKYDQASFVGQMHKTLPRTGPTGEQDGWKVQFKVFPLKASRYADDILTIAEEGALTVSIGMEGFDYGKTTNTEKSKYKNGSKVPVSIVRTWNWLEMSTTMMPANLRCRQIGYGDQIEIDTSTLKRIDIFDDLLVKGKIQIDTADALGFSQLVKLHSGKSGGRIDIDERAFCS